MKSTALLASLTFLAAVPRAFSQPHLVKHQHQHKARDVVWITSLAYETETVDITTTVWVTAGSDPVTYSPVVTTSTASDGEFFQSATSTSESPAAVVVSTSSTAPVVQAPVTQESTIATISSVKATSAVYVPQDTTTAAAVVIPTTLISTTSTTTAAAEATTAASSSSTTTSINTSVLNSGSDCVGVLCNGDLTYYTAALGACGYDTDGYNVLGIALPHEFMGTASNSNPYCNMTLEVTYGDTTVEATVIDKCMGCTGDSIDLTQALYGSLGINEALGRVTGSWKFTGPQTTQVFKSSKTYNYDS